MPRAKTVTAYIASLPEDEGAVIAKLRALIKKHLPKGYVESMTWGCPSYEVPLSVYPDTYNGYPMGYLAIASKKNYYTLHMMSAYMNPVMQQKIQAAFKKAGKKLNMGKACIRFKKLDDLPLPELGKLIASVPMKKYVARVQAAKK